MKSFQSTTILAQVFSHLTELKSIYNYWKSQFSQVSSLFSMTPYKIFKIPCFHDWKSYCHFLRFPDAVGTRPISIAPFMCYFPFSLLRVVLCNHLKFLAFNNSVAQNNPISRNLMRNYLYVAPFMCYFLLSIRYISFVKFRKFNCLLQIIIKF